jgi:hypothetical protein
LGPRHRARPTGGWLTGSWVGVRVGVWVRVRVGVWVRVRVRGRG